MSTVGETYVVNAYTTLTDDENDANDGVTQDIIHLNPNDIGVSEITSPSSGELLSNAESVTVTITNFGGATQYMILMLLMNLTVKQLPKLLPVHLRVIVQWNIHLPKQWMFLSLELILLQCTLH